MKAITLDDARSLGLMRYFTGKPCKHGHVAERLVSNRNCVECKASATNRHYARKWYERNKRAHAERSAKWHHDNPEKAKKKSRDYYQRNRDERQAKARARYAENRDAELRRKRLAYWANRQQQLKRMRRWRTENPEKARRSTVQWIAKNPEAIRVIYSRRRARERAAPGNHTIDDVRRLYRQQRGRCLNCQVSLKEGYHVDHIMPLARGGSNGPENLQLLCPPCNIAKNDKDPIAWAQENGRLL